MKPKIRLARSARECGGSIKWDTRLIGLEKSTRILSAAGGTTEAQTMQAKQKDTGRNIPSLLTARSWEPSLINNSLINGG